MFRDLQNELLHEKVIETLLPICKRAGADIDEYVSNIESIIQYSNRALIERIRSELPEKEDPTTWGKDIDYWQAQGHNETLDDVTAVLTVIEKENG